MTLVWGLAILTAYYGYGRALVRLLQPELLARAGWGLICVWGLCVLLALSGALLYLGWFGPGSAVGCIGLGNALLLIERWWRDPAGSVAARPESGKRLIGLDGAGALGLIPIGIVIAYYFGAVAWAGEVNANDDLVSYFAFPKMMLQSGTFLDPFALRRVTSFGGQSLLQSLTAFFGAERQYHFADSGLARVLLFGLLWGYLAPVRHRIPAIFALAMSLALLFKVPRINTSSELIHAVLLLALPLTLLATRRAASDDVQSDGEGAGLATPATLLAALVIFGASIFRPHIGFAAAVTYAFAVLWDPKVGGRPLGAKLANLVVVASMVALLLAPWSAMLHASSGTIVFPPFRGHLSAAFASMHMLQGTWLESIAATLELFGHRQLLAMLLPIALLGFRSPRISVVVCAAGLAVTVLTAFASTALSFSYFYRYVWPIPFAAMLFVGCTSLRELVDRQQQEGSRWDPRLRWAVIAVAFALAVAFPIRVGFLHFARVSGSIVSQTQLGVPPIRRKLQGVYRAAQDTIPRGEATLSMADLPFLFDHGRNRILTIDAPGAVSPDGAFPYFEGPESVRRYLLSHGIRYISYTPPENAKLLFRRDSWSEFAGGEEFYARVWAPPMLDLMNTIERLSHDHPLTFSHPKLKVVDLGAQTSAPPS